MNSEPLSFWSSCCSLGRVIGWAELSRKPEKEVDKSKDFSS